MLQFADVDEYRSGTRVAVCGADRSGTTLFARLLSQRSGALLLPENHFVFETWHSLGLRASASVDPRILRSRAVSMGFSQRLDGWGMSTDDAWDGGPWTLGDFIEKTAVAYARSSGQLERLNAGWISQNPRDVERIHILNEAVHGIDTCLIVRDGRAVYSSIRTLPWGRRSASGVAEWWLGRVGLGLAALAIDQNVDKKIRHFRFEDVISSGLAEAFSGQEGASCLAVPVVDRRNHRLVEGPVEDARASAWERELTESQVRHFESVAWPMLRYLGYDVVPAPRVHALRLSADAVCDGAVALWYPVLRKMRACTGDVRP